MGKAARGAEAVELDRLVFIIESILKTRIDSIKKTNELSVMNCFIRGSVVGYVQLPPDGVDIELLYDVTRREARGG
ncbi:hypothetical protein CsSME_00017493 [Camellia sinensis var. sinensis]